MLLGLVNPLEAVQIKIGYGQSVQKVFEKACKVIAGMDSDKSDEEFEDWLDRVSQTCGVLGRTMEANGEIVDATIEEVVTWRFW